MPVDRTDELLPSEAARFDEVCRLGQDRRDAVALTVAAAFADDPIWTWTHDVGGRVPVETGMVLARMLVARSSPADEIHGFRHHGAVALWGAPADRQTDDLQRLVDERTAPFFAPFAEQMGERLTSTGALADVMKQHRPLEPHWYLSILATDPDRQNQGLGGRVLTAMLDRCDRLGLPSYLESSNPRNYGFYRRYGYVETERFSALDSPPLAGFWREPR